jgi:hypothetical protein
MDSVEAAKQTAAAIGQLGGAFMIDGSTFARGGELGFGGLDFYVLGRGGVLGDTTAEVVSSAFIVWNPEAIATQWALGRAVMTPAEAADEWVAVCASFGEANLPDFDGYGRLNELMATIVNAASPACVALFAGWRTMPVPGADAPKALAQHLLNSLRELRGGLHGGALLAAGVTPLEAVAFNSPFMAPIFGWDAENLPDGAAIKERWKAGEAATNVAMAVPLSVLSETELAEFVELINALHAAVQAAKEA